MAAEIIEVKSPSGQTQGFMVRSAMHVAQALVKSKRAAEAVKRDMDRKVVTSYDWHNEGADHRPLAYRKES